MGEKGRRIRELTLLVQKRFGFQDGTVELYAEKVNNRGLSAVAQAESLKYKLLAGLAVRRAAYSVMRLVMEAGAKGVEVVISGKLRAARAKSMKFADGFMIHSGQPAQDYIDYAVRHVLLRQGVLGVKVKIMQDYDPTGKNGPKHPLPDLVHILEPKDLSLDLLWSMLQLLLLKNKWFQYIGLWVHFLSLRVFGEVGERAVLFLIFNSCLLVNDVLLL